MKRTTPEFYEPLENHQQYVAARPGLSHLGFLGFRIPFGGCCGTEGLRRGTVVLSGPGLPAGRERGSPCSAPGPARRGDLPDGRRAGQAMQVPRAVDVAADGRLMDPGAPAALSTLSEGRFPQAPGRLHVGACPAAADHAGKGDHRHFMEIAMGRVAGPGVAHPVGDSWEGPHCPAS